MKKRLFLLLGIVVLISTVWAVSHVKPFVHNYYCVGCQACVKVCPTGAIQMYGAKAVIDQEKCIDCRLCMKTCTYKAIRRTK